jgi:hypothetical protein
MGSLAEARVQRAVAEFLVENFLNFSQARLQEDSTHAQGLLFRTLGP